MKVKIPYSIQRSIVKILPFIATAIMSASCHKEPYDVVIDWDWNDAPNQELVKRYANDKNVNTVILNLRPYGSNAYSPNNFRNGRNYLENNYFSFNPDKIRGNGDIYVDPNGGAQLPYPLGDTIRGMYAADYDYFTLKGFNIVLGRPPKISR